MINNLSFVCRFIRKQKAFSLINLLGLAASMAVCLLVLLFVHEQQSFDQFHQHKDRIYRVTSDLPNNSQDFATSPPPLAPTLLEEYTGVEAAVRLRKTQANIIYENDLFPQRGLYAEPSFFHVFSFGLASGAPSTALANPYSVVLSQKLASRIFGDSNPMGKTITLGETGTFVVTGVLEPLEHKSHLDFDVLFSFSTLRAQEKTSASLQDWESQYTYYTYLLVNEGASRADIEAHLSTLSRRFYPFEGEDHAFGLQALTNISLGEMMLNELSTGTIPGFVVYFLGALCLIIIITAGFNYTNLSIARSLKRAKEVGIRRAVGAYRWQIVLQFLIESVVFAVVSLLGALLLLLWLIPAFNSLHVVQQLGVALSFDFLRDPTVFLLFIGFALLIGLLSGLYPALRLSRHLPAQVLQGSFTQSEAQGFKGAFLRKTFIIAQFVFSLVFVISALLLYQQFTFMLDADHGFDAEQLVSVESTDTSYVALSNELQSYPEIERMSAASLNPGSNAWTTTTMQSDSTTAPIEANYYATDEQFIETVGLTLTAGEIIAGRFTSGQTVVLNETAVHALDWATPQAAIGQTVLIGRDQSPRQIAAVVQDYHARSLRQSIEPLILHYDAKKFRYLLLRAAAPEDRKDIAAAVKSVWPQLNPADPLELVSVEAMLEKRSAPFRDLVQVLGLVAAFAVFIACLGTLGMASYSTEVRSKEIGIRKVLGARVSSLALLLSKEFLILLVLSVLIGTPLAYFINHMWIQTFAYHASAGLGTYAAGIGALLLPAFLAVGSQTVKAALTNPVNMLRHE